ncbi:MAG: hypothetical protein AAGF01_23805 [Cyanobacteria bacterium P01_G01_bin.38]
MTYADLLQITANVLPIVGYVELSRVFTEEGQFLGYKFSCRSNDAVDIIDEQIKAHPNYSPFEVATQKVKRGAKEVLVVIR